MGDRASADSLRWNLDLILDQRGGDWRICPGRQGSVSAAVTAADDFQFPELAPGDYEITSWRLVGGIGSVLVSGSPICEETVKVTVRDGTVSNVMLRPLPVTPAY